MKSAGAAMMAEWIINLETQGVDPKPKKSGGKTPALGGSLG